MRRALYIRGIDETLELSKVTCIKTKGPSMVHLDQLTDGTWRLIYHERIGGNLGNVSGIDVIREN